MSQRNREIKIHLTVHEDGIASAPTNDELKVMVGAEDAALFVVERVTIPMQRVRAPEISPVMDMKSQLVAWLTATQQEVDPARLERLEAKFEEISG